MPEEYVPRLSVEISEETQQRLANLIPWGLKSKVMSILLEDILDLVEAHGNIVLAAIIDRTLSARHIVKGLNSQIKEAKGGTARPEEKHK